MTTPLISIAPPQEPAVVVVLDRAHARFFDVHPDGARELASLHSPAMRGGKFHSDRQGGPGWGEHDYHARIAEEEHRHFAAIAERLGELLRSHPAKAIVLAGTDQAAAALKRALPPAILERVIGTARLNVTEVTAAAVDRAVSRLREEHEHQATHALMATLREALGTGWAENGTRAVLGALAKGQVRMLIVRPDVRGTGFRCATSGRLVLSAADCRGEGAPVPVNDLIGEAIKEAERQHVEVKLVRDPEATHAIDGLAALLRFR